MLHPKNLQHSQTKLLNPHGHPIRRWVLKTESWLGDKANKSDRLRACWKWTLNIYRDTFHIHGWGKNYNLTLLHREQSTQRFKILSDNPQDHNVIVWLIIKSNGVLQFRIH